MVICAMVKSVPFARFAPAIATPPDLRRAITAATRRAEADCVQALLPEATLHPQITNSAQKLARQLVEALLEPAADSTGAQ